LKLVDTSVFIYAIGRPHDYKMSCLRLMQQFESGEYEANVDTELLQEILYRFWNREQLDRGIALFNRVLSAFPDPFSITTEEIVVARSVLGNHPEIAPRDAIHAAVVLVHGLEGIISTDGDFNDISGVTRFDPKDL